MQYKKTIKDYPFCLPSFLHNPRYDVYDRFPWIGHQMYNEILSWHFRHVFLCCSFHFHQQRNFRNLIRLPNANWIIQNNNFFISIFNLDCASVHKYRINFEKGKLFLWLIYVREMFFKRTKIIFLFAMILTLFFVSSLKEKCFIIYWIEKNHSQKQ